jgi:hypothetical protein
MLTPEKVHNVSLGAVKPTDIPEPHRQAAHGTPLGGASLLGAHSGGTGEDGESRRLDIVSTVHKSGVIELKCGV